MLFRSGMPVVAGLLIAAWAESLQAAVPNDLASYMPEETAVYVGWSAWPSQDRVQLELAAKLLESTSERQEGPPRVISVILLDLLLPMSNAPVGIGLQNIELNDGAEVSAALIAAAGPDPQHYPQVVRGLIAECGDPELIQPLTIKNVQFQQYAVPETPFKFVWGVHKDCFILTLGESAAAAVIDTMNGARPSLAASEEMKFDRSKVQARLDGTFTCLYGDVQRVVDIVKGVVAAKADGLPEWFNPLIEETGIASVRSKYQHFEERDDERYVRIFAHVTGPVRGLLTLWKQAPLTDEDLRVVPDDAYWMYARNVDLAALWQEVLRVTKEAAPEVGARVEAGEAALAGMFGFSIVRDLLPKFGDTWVLFDAPQQGGFLITGAVLVAETTDAAGLNAILSAVIARTNAALGGTENRVVSKELEYAGHRIHYVVVSALPVPVAPAWCIVGQRVIFGLYPQTVAAAIRRLDAAPATTEPAPATPAARSILDNPEFRAARASLPGPAVGIGYADARLLWRLAYPLVLGVRTAFASWAEPAGAAIDFATTPPWPEARELVRVHVSTSIMDEDGVILASQGGDGRGPVMTRFANAGALFGMSWPSLSRARELAKRAASMANLRAIGEGCRSWAKQHGGQFPDSLGDLLVEGLITEKMLHSRRDPTGGVSYIYIPGQNEKSDPRNVLAFERLYDDKGTNVLFVAGYVEYLSPEAAEQALAETYIRLGREGVVPTGSGLPGE